MSVDFTKNAKTVRRYLYEQFIAEGQGPNVTKIMQVTGLSKSQVEDALLELERGVMIAQERDAPGVVVKCMPWASFPTPHYVEVEGMHNGYAGCAFEALNMPYCHPGKLISVSSSCSQCGQEVKLSLRDEEILSYSPKETVIHIGVYPQHWRENLVKACANTSFFCCPEHVREWEKAKPEFRGVMMSIETGRQMSRYPHRLDHERGPEQGTRVLEKLREMGVPVPAHWQ